MGRGGNQTGTEQQTEVAKKGAGVGTKNGKFTREQVAEHNKAGDAWLILRDNVYDISHFDAHPGGRVILTHAGMDATDIFNAFHSAAANHDLGKYRIGTVDAAAAPGASSAAGKKDKERAEKEARMMAEFRQIRTQMQEEGLFVASPLYYVFKVASTFAILVTAVLVGTYYTSLPMRTLSACILALFWQQCGWLAHDFVHHQVFTNRTFNDYVGIVVGNLWQGFSMAWWKDKHNTHHAVPNLHDTDPDIDTAPILAWSRKIAAKYNLADASTVDRFLIRVQAFTYFPILTFARLSWCMSSILYVFVPWGPIHYAVLEKSGLVAHWALYLYFLYANMTLPEALYYFLVSEGMCGFLLALVFGVGHNGMHTFDEKPTNFLAFQVLSTRNVESTFFIDWFMGGLQAQVEHHLFPTMPRHNLHLARARIEALCKKYDVPYHSTSLFQGQVEVLGILSDVASSIKK